MIVFKTGKPGMTNASIQIGEVSEKNVPYKCYVEREASGDLNCLVDVMLDSFKDGDYVLFEYPKEKGRFEGTLKKTKEGFEFVGKD